MRKDSWGSSLVRTNGVTRVLGGSVVNDHDLGVCDFVVLRRTISPRALNVLLGGEALVEASLIARDLFLGRGGSWPARAPSWCLAGVLAKLCRSETIGCYRGVFQWRGGQLLMSNDGSWRS